MLGQDLALPLVLAPLGLAGILARRAEVQAARAAAAAGVPFCESTVSVCSLEEVRAATAAPFWYQLTSRRPAQLIARKPKPKVKSTRVSMKTRPMSIGVWILSAAWGFRAMPSSAAAVARP